jgi:hypothetical protein
MLHVTVKKFDTYDFLLDSVAWDTQRVRMTKRETLEDDWTACPKDVLPGCWTCAKIAYLRTLQTSQERLRRRPAKEPHQAERSHECRVER